MKNSSKLTPILIFALLFIGFQNMDRIIGWVDPAPDFSHLPANTVVMYSTQSCGYCAKARRLFNQMNIAYEERDVEKSQTFAKEFKKLGGRGVPLIVIGESVIKGYSRDKIIELLENQENF